ncbi:MAG: type I restriction endonuclease subunit R [Bacteroidales bacterium]|nr:type I restriction endonuclease subunit R [Bacteroidales bacterium]MCF8404480.1 type I restriction endonuclease subunit R [Bacteroidales bacterium]
MRTQSEAILEKKLIEQLSPGLGYEFVQITDEEGILKNLKAQLERFNKTIFSVREFKQVLNHLSKGNVFERAKILRDRFVLVRDNQEKFYLQFFDSEDLKNNHYQVTNQVTVVGTYKNRYDVTILVNGLPLAQIELKRRGLELKEAFNQINRYKRHSFWANSGLFQFIQIFVISNGVNTKYYANNPLTTLTFKQTFFWANEKNRNITGLTDFASAFLNKNRLGKMIAHYVVHNESFKVLMVMRPYQVYAVEAIVDRVKAGMENGYIWHTTGSGKTLTSFKASQIVMNLPEVQKVVFVVDRKDLDYHTANEFNSFKKGSVDMTDNTRSLIKQLIEKNKLIVTTIQKLNNAINKFKYEKKISYLKLARMVFIFDECHRSQFGETHKRITSYFKNAQLFGFTGTPIFADNALSNELGKRTTKDLFTKCLHKYVITDAIRDQNVLKFSVEYIGKYKQKSNTYVDIEVEDIDKKEVIESPVRCEKIVDYIIKYHDQKTHNREYTAMFAVSSIETLIRYYELFKAKKEAGLHNLRIATVFSYGANEEDQDATGEYPDEFARAAEDMEEYKHSHSRDKLEEFIGDYNSMFGTRFNLTDNQSFENYHKDISKRIKDREKVGFNDKNRLDIFLVVNMYLTGFDAKKVNTIYVDKSLRYHGLVQTYSRSNRILNEQKSQGNILCFRNLKKATDEAIALFSNKEALEEIFLPPYEAIVRKFAKAFGNLLAIAPTVKSVDDLKSEEEELEFIKAFRELMRLHNVLKVHTDFTWDDLPVSQQAFEDYKSKYLDLHDKVRSQQRKEKASILEDVDFEIELIHRDEINVAYILKLLAKLKLTEKTKQANQKKAILDLLSGELQLRSKRELIEKFIDENLPRINDADNIPDEFEKYWEEQRVEALNAICEEEDLDQKQFSNLIDSYIFNGQEPIKDDVFKCLEHRPSVLKAREIGERIIEKMKLFVEVFVRGVAA